MRMKVCSTKDHVNCLWLFYVDNVFLYIGCKGCWLKIFSLILRTVNSLLSLSLNISKPAANTMPHAYLFWKILKRYVHLKNTNDIHCFEHCFLCVRTDIDPPPLCTSKYSKNLNLCIALSIHNLILFPQQQQLLNSFGIVMNTYTLSYTYLYFYFEASNWYSYLNQKAFLTRKHSFVDVNNVFIYYQ